MTSRPNANFLQIACSVLAILVSSVNMKAQVLYGTLVGNVTDQSAGAVAGALVKIMNRGTGQSNQSTTNEAGLYTFQNVSAGVYDLTVTAAGFGSYTTEGIELNVNTVQRHDVIMKVGQVSETIKVEASAVTLQTDRGDISVEIPTSV